MIFFPLNFLKLMVLPSRPGTLKLYIFLTGANSSTAAERNKALSMTNILNCYAKNEQLVSSIYLSVYKNITFHTHPGQVFHLLSACHPGQQPGKLRFPRLLQASLALA